MTHPKPLFVPWLYQKIESGSYPGVCWTSKELQQFSIPWKHALRQDKNSDDVLIFKAWAQTSASGDRINGDPSIWKRNFRSALRAKGFKMVLDNKNDTADPHKVYQFPSDCLSAGSEGSQETDFSPELYLDEESVFSKNPSQGLEGQLTGLNLHESPSRVWNSEQLYLGQQLFQTLDPCSEPQFTGMAHFQRVDPPGAFSSAGGAVGGLGQISPTDAAMAVNPHSPEYQQPAACPPHAEGNQDAIPEPKLETCFRIKVYYKGKMVLEQLVENSGFRLMYQENIDESRADLPVVRLPPPPDDIPDQNQIRLTNDILNNLGGLEVRRSDAVVYGHRWGNTRIYWGLCKHEKSPTTRELAKNTPDPIFFFKNYISGLMEFMETSRESPSYTLYFFLGEKWPDPKMKPWEKKLVMIEVILTSLEGLNTLAVSRGASSLQSVELQLSLEQMMELCDTK
nr:interferon regulator factor 3 [Pimephales promelas]